MSKRPSIKAAKRENLGQAIPVKLPPSLQLEVERLANESGLSQADIMRQAIKRGMGAVERIFGKAA